MAVLLLVAFTAGAAALFTFLKQGTLQQQVDNTTNVEAARAKDALMGYAVSNSVRPGAFPCPDTDNDGAANDDATCTPAVAGGAVIGRIPWKTLGMPQAIEQSGEVLWYALSDRFRANTAAGINSDSRGDITLRAPDGTLLLDANHLAAAVIIAPGAVRQGQSRGSASVTCAASGTVIRQDLCASNYVDTGTTPSASTTLTAGLTTSSTNNDRLLAITVPEFMPLVELRVASELRKALDAYRASAPCQCYPFAERMDEVSDGISDVGVLRGRFPTTLVPAQTQDWGALLPAWVRTNRWHEVIYYSVSELAAPLTGLPSCNPVANCTLTVDNSPGVLAVFFTPGTPLPAPRATTVPANVPNPQRRGNSLGLCATTGTQLPANLCIAELSNIFNYVEDTRNQPANDIYFTPPVVDSSSRDRLTVFKGPTGNQCNVAASQLAALVTKMGGCGMPSVSSLSSQCKTYVADLAACGCFTSAYSLLRPPCGNTLGPAVCGTHITALQGCFS